MANGEGWIGPTLSDRVAERIVKFRKRPGIDLTREQLAQRCADEGAPWLTFSTLTNIETGRRKDGARRRDVTIDELVIIARAMRVPPILLIFPLGNDDETEILPGQTIATWSALEWFEGRSPFPVQGDPGGGPMTDSGIREWYNDPESGWEAAAAPAILFAEHDRLYREWSSAAARANQLFTDLDGQLDNDKSTSAALRWRADAERGLRRVRADMRRHGLKPPRLPDHLQHLDDREQL